MSDKFEVQSLIVADDVRVEVSGKHIIIGAYAGAVVVPSIPYLGALAIRLEVIVKEKKEYKVECTILNPDKTVWAKEESITDVLYPQFGVALAFPNMTGTVNEPGRFEILLAIDDEARSVGSVQIISAEGLRENE